MSTRSQLIEEYAGWLKKWNWDWFATLTFPGYPRRSSALRKFEQWIAEIEREQGTRDFRHVRVFETGAYGDNVHIHVLVGGLKRQARLFPAPWRERWEEIAGRAAIVPFDTEKGGVYYVLKTLDPARDFDFDLHLPERRTKESASELLKERSTLNKESASTAKKRREEMKVYKDTVLQKKTTKSMVVYGNQVLPSIYIPKTMLRAVYGKKDRYPKELVLLLRTTGSTVNSVNSDQKRLLPASQPPRQQRNGKDLTKAGSSR